MLDPVSVALKFGFLIVLYLFLMWVAWSATRDLRRGRGGASALEHAPVAPADATGMYDAAAGLGDPELDDAAPQLLVQRAPGHESGQRLRHRPRRHARTG